MEMKDFGDLIVKILLTVSIILLVIVNFKQNNEIESLETEVSALDSENAGQWQRISEIEIILCNLIPNKKHPALLRGDTTKLTDDDIWKLGIRKSDDGIWFGRGDTLSRYWRQRVYRSPGLNDWYKERSYYYDLKCGK